MPPGAIAISPPQTVGKTHRVYGPKTFVYLTAVSGKKIALGVENKKRQQTIEPEGTSSTETQITL